MKTLILKDIDTLSHNKQNGFYDSSLDMYFIDLNEWLTFKYNKTWNDIL